MTFQPVKLKYKVKNYDYPNKDARWIDKDSGLRKNMDGTLERPKFLKQNHKGALTKTKKKIAAKLMYEAGWGSRDLKDWFKTSQPTIVNWSKLPTPEALKEWETNFKAAMMDYDMEAHYKIKSRIMEIVPEEKNIDKLVKAGEFFRGESTKRSGNNTQVNIYADMLKKYRNVEDQ